MALIWSQDKNGKRYEVRTAGNSVRLYTDGVFHSQWNPRKPLSGHLWDLLFLPVFFHANPEKIDKILMLGVGGGAAINTYKHYFPRTQVTGVDLDKVHLFIAKKYFLRDCEKIDLVHHDALQFVSSDRKTYDVVVEDLFLGSSADKSDAVRPIVVDDAWLCAMCLRLAPEGVLVINFENTKQLRRSLTKDRLKRYGFGSVYVLSNPRYENAIAACVRGGTNKREFMVQARKVLAATSIRDVERLASDMRKVY